MEGPVLQSTRSDGLLAGMCALPGAALVPIADILLEQSQLTVIQVYLDWIQTGALNPLSGVADM